MRVPPVTLIATLCSLLWLPLYTGADASAQVDSTIEAPSPTRWSVRGRVGVEVAAQGEHFGSDAFLSGAAEIDDVLDSLRFRSQGTFPGGLVQLAIEHEEAPDVRVDAAFRVSEARARADLETYATWRHAGFRFLLLDRLEAENGDASAGGLIHALTAGAARPLGRSGAELALRWTEERSWAGEDSLRSLFAYRLARPTIRLSLPLGVFGELRLEGSRHRRWSEGANSSRGGWCEVEAMRSNDEGRVDRIALRTESRRYLQSDPLFPSEDRWGAEVEGERRVVGPFALRLADEFQEASYAADSDLFADHRENTARLALLAEWPAFSGTEFRCEAIHGVIRHESDRTRDSDRLGIGVGLARTAESGLWCDFGAEYGRRDFRVSGAGQGIDYDGFTFSFEGSDHTYASVSVVGEAPLPGRFRLDLFGHWEDERHDAEEDDVRLWILDLALTRAF